MQCTREFVLLSVLFFSIIYINLRFSLHLITTPDLYGEGPFAPALRRHVLYSQRRAAAEAQVGEAFEFAQLADTSSRDSRSEYSSSADGGKNAVIPDSLPEHTILYPPWVYAASLFIPRRVLTDPVAVCEALKELTLPDTPFRSVVLDAGWWAPEDMYAPSPDLFDVKSTHSRIPTRGNNAPLSLLRALLVKNCPAETTSTLLIHFPTKIPVLLWSSALVPVSDKRYTEAARRGYFIHSGDTVDSHKGSSETKDPRAEAAPFQPHRFTWLRDHSEDAAGRQYHLEGSLIDYSHPDAVGYFAFDGEMGFTKLLSQFADIAGFRMGGTDALLRALSPSTRVLGKKGYYSPEEYTHDYYRITLDAGRRITTKLNTWERKARQRQREESEDTTKAPSSSSNNNINGIVPLEEAIHRDFVLFARTIDSHNKQHFFLPHSPTDAAAMGFVGDHALTYDDLRESALNVIHSTYQCYSSVGSIVGAPPRAGQPAEQPVDYMLAMGMRTREDVLRREYLGVLERVDDMIHNTTSSSNNNDSKNYTQVKHPSQCSPVHKRHLLVAQWILLAARLPNVYIPADYVPLLRSPTLLEAVRLLSPNDNSNNKNTPIDERSTLLSYLHEHNALIPYYVSNAVRSHLFDIVGLHVPTGPHDNFRTYLNAHGNPFCAIRYVPQFLHHMYQSVVASSNATSTSTTGTNKVRRYIRNYAVSRSDLPHILFEAPADDYQFQIGPSILAVPQLALAHSPHRDVTLPLPLLLPDDAEAMNNSSSNEGQNNDKERRLLPTGVFCAEHSDRIEDSSQWLDITDPYDAYSTTQQQLSSTSRNPNLNDNGIMTGVSAKVKLDGLAGAQLVRRGAVIPLFFEDRKDVNSKGSSDSWLVFAVDRPYTCGAVHTGSVPFSYHHWIGGTARIQVNKQYNHGDNNYIIEYIPTRHSHHDTLKALEGVFTTRRTAVSITLPILSLSPTDENKQMPNRCRCIGQSQLKGLLSEPTMRGCRNSSNEGISLTVMQAEVPTTDTTSMTRVIATIPCTAQSLSSKDKEVTSTTPTPFRQMLHQRHTPPPLTTNTGCGLLPQCVTERRSSSSRIFVMMPMIMRWRCQCE